MAEDDTTQKIVQLLDGLIEDTSIPRNVRNSISSAKQKLTASEDKLAGLSGAIYALDEVSNDINLPMHGRTMIWNILSELEMLKEKSRQ
jgi:hypothetical protein